MLNAGKKGTALFLYIIVEVLAIVLTYYIIVSSFE